MATNNTNIHNNTNISPNTTSTSANNSANVNTSNSPFGGFCTPPHMRATKAFEESPLGGFCTPPHMREPKVFEELFGSQKTPAPTLADFKRRNADKIKSRDEKIRAIFSKFVNEFESKLIDIIINNEYKITHTFNKTKYITLYNYIEQLGKTTFNKYFKEYLGNTTGIKLCYNDGFDHKSELCLEIDPQLFKD